MLVLNILGYNVLTRVNQDSRKNIFNLLVLLLSLLNFLTPQLLTQSMVLVIAGLFLKYGCRKLRYKKDCNSRRFLISVLISVEVAFELQENEEGGFIELWNGLGWKVSKGLPSSNSSAMCRAINLHV